MIKKYQYNGETYTSKYMLRKAVWEHDRTAISIPNPETAEAWAALVKSSYDEESEKVIETPLGIVYTEETEPELTEEEKEAQALAEAKAERAQAVASIKVTVGTKVFDGDEAAQSRMTRALQVAEITGMKSTAWVLADNTVAEVTVEEMKEALSKAMLAMGELWTVPYENKEEPAEDKKETEETESPLPEVGV